MCERVEHTHSILHHAIPIPMYEMYRNIRNALESEENILLTHLGCKYINETNKRLQSSFQPRKSLFFECKEMKVENVIVQ